MALFRPYARDVHIIDNRAVYRVRRESGTRAPSPLIDDRDDLVPLVERRHHRARPHFGHVDRSDWPGVLLFAAIALGLAAFIAFVHPISQ